MDGWFWEQYAADSDSNYNEEFARFISGLATSLRCESVLEVGCNAGNDLRLFGPAVQAHGLDVSHRIAARASKRHPGLDIAAGSAEQLPYRDASVDIVFTHGFFNHLEDQKVDACVAELFRVARRYVTNCEVMGEDNILDDKTRRAGRNMHKRWAGYGVRIVSNVEMHEDIDPEKPRFVLVRKL